MSTIVTLITNEGLTKVAQAAGNAGWYIYPTTFSVSNLKGVFDITRTEDTMLQTWYDAAISSKVSVPPSTVTFICTIPPGVSGTEKEILEIYLNAVDQLGNSFLFALGQPSSAIRYDPEGAISFRISISLINVNLSQLIQFNYTQATEINEHNLDPVAHQDLQFAMSKGGLYVSPADFKNEGQSWDENAVYTSDNIHHGSMVLRNIQGEYELATASGSKTTLVGMAYIEKGAHEWRSDHSYVMGTVVYPTSKNQHTYKTIVAGKSSSVIEPTWPLNLSELVVDNEVTWMEETHRAVLFSGIIEKTHSYPSGTWLYLDDNHPGELTDLVTTAKCALALNDNKLFLYPNNLTQSTNISAEERLGSYSIDLFLNDIAVSLFWATGKAVQFTGDNLPSPIVQNVTYYIINSGPGKVKLAETYADAIDGNAITLESSGVSYFIMSEIVTRPVSTIIETINTWTLSGQLYYRDIDITRLSVTVFPSSVQCFVNNKIINVYDIERINDNTLRIWMPTDTIAVTVTIVG